MSFDPDAYLAAKQTTQSFDPDAYLNSKIANKNEDSPLKSAAAGASQGATLGFADEGAAAISTLAEAGKNLLKGEIDPQALSDYYRKSRDTYRSGFDKAKEDNPKSYLAGEFAGGAASAPLTGEAIGLIPKVGPAVGTIRNLALMGAAQGIGNSEADLTQGDLGGMTKDAAIGGMIGGVAGGVFKGLGKLAPESLRKTAQDFGTKALGYSKRLINTPEARQAAQTMLDNGVIKPFASPEDMALNVGNLLEDSGKAIGKFLEKKGNGYSTQSAIEAINGLRPKGDSGQWLRGGEYDKINAALDNALATVQAHGDTIPFQEANRLKGFLQDLVNWNSTRSESQIGKGIASAVKNSIDNTLAEVSGGMDDPAFLNFLQNKKNYQGAMNAQDALSNRISSDLSNKKFGLTDTIVAASNPNVGGAAAVAGKKAFERYGNQTVAVGANKAAKASQWVVDQLPAIIKTSPQSLGKYATTFMNASRNGSQAVATANFVLMNKDPEYRQMIRGLQEQNKE